MVFKPKSYPYPLLASFTDDYRGVTFAPTVNVERSDNGKTIEFEVQAIDFPPSISDAIINQHAQLVVDVDNPGALFRHVVPTNEGKFTLSAGQVLGEVFVTPLVLAATSFDFQPSAQNEVSDVYEGVAAFKIAPGDPLAIGESVTVHIDYSGKSSNNLFEMVADPNAPDNLFTVSTGSDALQIRVSPAAHATFTTMYRTKQTRPHFIMGVAKDAILIAISALTAGDDVMDRAWARALSERIEDINPSLLEGDVEFNLVDAHKVAQEIVRSQGIDELVASDE